MMMKHETVHGSWTRSPAFIMAGVGATIGLANFWRFPYAMAEHGGLWFLLAYVLFLLVFGLPLLYAELLLGRASRCSPIVGGGLLAREAGLCPRWGWVGVLGPIAGLLTLSVYVLVAGMTLAYLFKAALGEFNGAMPNDMVEPLLGLKDHPGKLLVWEVVFLAGVFVVLGRGVNRGLERAVRYLIPLFFLLLVVLLVYGWRNGDLPTAFDYLLLDGREAFSWLGLASAAQHAFFTLAIGMGAMMMYGAYSPGRRGLLWGASWIVGLDIVVAVLAGFMIFPLVFSAGFGPAQGFDLLFQVVPMTYGQLPGGQFWATLFFALMILAVWTAAMALGEPWVAWLVERFGWRRWLASLAVLAPVAALAFGLNLGFQAGVEWSLAGIPMFSFVMLVVSGLLIPGAAMLIAVFVGWVLPRASVQELVESLEARWFYLVWHFLLRFVAPVLLCALILFTITSFIMPVCVQGGGGQGGLCSWLAPGDDLSVTEQAVMGEVPPVFDNPQSTEEIDDQDR